MNNDDDSSREYMTDLSSLDRQELEEYAESLEYENKVLKEAVERATFHLGLRSEEFEVLAEILEEAGSEVSDVELYEPDVDDVMDDMRGFVDDRYGEERGDTG